jgi:integrase
VRSCAECITRDTSQEGPLSPSTNHAITASRNARDHCWTREQLVALLDHSRDRDDRLHPLWFLIATTGLRRAEALALRWDDVDLDRARLTIRQTVTVANGVIVWQRDAKSDDSERTIALDARTVAVLHDHRRRQVAEAGLPRIGVHGLRHTWATLAQMPASPIKVVSQRIGHADPAVTMQVYAHALDGDDATAAELTAAAIFGDRYR